MLVYKFGGTSVGSVENMNAVIDIVTDGNKKIIVLSAMSGTTNSLVEISDYLCHNNKDGANGAISKLEAKYRVVIDSMFEGDLNAEVSSVVETRFNVIRSFCSGDFTEVGERTILAQGELISTYLVTQLMKLRGYSAELLPALDFMRIDADKSADMVQIKEKITKVLDEAPEAEYYITQGFICINSEGEIDNLQRGGSDYTASLIGSAIKADEIQIWTDIDGFHNNDPRYVENTSKVDNLSFDEAAELAYFGAKILHPQTVLPAKQANIPVRLKNTMNPSDCGTLISLESTGDGLKAVAAKDNITAIKIRSGRMLNAYGFLKNVFEVFERYKTSIDMITTSEVAVSVTIDDDRNLDKIVKDLKRYGEVEVDSDQAIVCVVGNLGAGEDKEHGHRVISSLKDVPLRMISYGGSKHNISLLVPGKFKVMALNLLSENLFVN